MYSNKIYISYYGMLAMHAGVEGSAILQLVMELGERLKYIRPSPPPHSPLTPLILTILLTF